jgi:thiol-disulfide isomerase/thioredoxin
LPIAVAAWGPAPETADPPAASRSSASPTTAASATSSAVPASARASAAASAAADALLAVALTDVRSGESFTLAELSADQPVLLEPMAVWCSNCRAQQHEVKEAHAAGSFVSVSLDIDLSESAADLASYADREGFDWRFAMADADLYRLLQERFGVAVTNPPSTPLIVIEPGGVVRPLEFGQGTRSAEALLAELEGG